MTSAYTKEGMKIRVDHVCIVKEEHLHISCGYAENKNGVWHVVLDCCRCLFCSTNFKMQLVINNEIVFDNTK